MHHFSLFFVYSSPNTNNRVFDCYASLYETFRQLTPIQFIVLLVITTTMLIGLVSVSLMFTGVRFCLRHGDRWHSAGGRASPSKSRINWESVWTSLSTISWGSMLHNQSTFDELDSQLWRIFKQFVPMTAVRHRSGDSPWFDGECVKTCLWKEANCVSSVEW